MPALGALIAPNGGQAATTASVAPLPAARGMLAIGRRPDSCSRQLDGDATLWDVSGGPCSSASAGPRDADPRPPPPWRRCRTAARRRLGVAQPVAPGGVHLGVAVLVAVFSTPWPERQTATAAGAHRRRARRPSCRRPSAAAVISGIENGTWRGRPPPRATPALTTDPLTGAPQALRRQPRGGTQQDELSAPARPSTATASPSRSPAVPTRRRGRAARRRPGAAARAPREGHGRRGRRADVWGSGRRRRLRR